MALTFDTKARIPATALTTTTADPVTANYTCGANAKVLVVMILYAGNTQRTGGAPTYNGVALTQAESLAGVTEAVCELWYMLNPPTGAEYQISIQNDNTRTIWVYVASGNAASGYTCALDDTGITETTSSNPTVNVVTTVVGTLIFACVASGDNTFAPTARTGTSLYEEDISAYGGAAQYYVMAGSGSQNMSWTEATSDDYGAIAIAFKEVLAAILLEIQDASNAHTSESPALTQHNILTIQEASNAHTAENIALIQHNILAVQDAAHAHLADGPDLIQHNILAIQDVTHGHQAENPTLTAHEPSAQLEIQDAAHSHLADGPDLVQHNLLAIQDGAHAHLADGLDLAQHNILAIQDAAHLHMAENVTITAYPPGGVSLVIADASHGHQAENVTVTAHEPGAISLTIADASHAHQAENLDLVQHHILEIQDAYHLHSADQFSLIVGGGSGHDQRKATFNGLFKGIHIGMEGH